MDLRTFVRVITRHWVVVTIALMITVIAAVGLVTQIKPTYAVKGSMLVLTKPTGTTNEGKVEINPLTNPAQVAAASTALVEIMLSEPYIERMKDEGMTGTYALDIPPNGSGAILGLKVEDTSPEAAEASYEILANAVQEEVLAFQRRAGIPESTLIGAQELTPPTRATVVAGGRITMLAGVLILGFGASFSLAFVADLIYGDNRRPLRLRRRRGTSETVDVVDSARDQDEVEVDDPTGTDWHMRRRAMDPSGEPEIGQADETGPAHAFDPTPEPADEQSRRTWRRARPA